MDQERTGDAMISAETMGEIEIERRAKSIVSMGDSCRSDRRKSEEEWEDAAPAVIEIVAEIRRLREALGWYANPNHWEWTTHESTRDGCGCTDVSTWKFPLQAPIQVGGKRAREAMGRSEG